MFQKLMLGAVLLGALLVVQAQAATVSYTVDGWGPQQFPGQYASFPDENWSHGADGYPGDTIELEGFTGSLSLPDGPVGTQTQVVQKIGTLKWIVDYTAGGETDDWESWVAQSLPVDTSRNIAISGATTALDQSGELTNDPYFDYLGFSDGTMATLYVSGTWKVEITPIGLPEVQMNNWSGNRVVLSTGSQSDQQWSAVHTGGYWYSRTQWQLAELLGRLDGAANSLRQREHLVLRRLALQRSRKKG